MFVFYSITKFKAACVVHLKRNKDILIFRRVSLQDSPMPSVMEQWHQESTSRDEHVMSSHQDNQVLRHHHEVTPSFESESPVVPPTSSSQDLVPPSGHISETLSGDFVSLETEDKTICDRNKTSKRTVNNNLEVPDENSSFSWRQTLTPLQWMKNELTQKYNMHSEMTTTEYFRRKLPCKLFMWLLSLFMCNSCWQNTKICYIGVMESRVLDFHIFPFPVHCFCIVKLS